MSIGQRPKTQPGATLDAASFAALSAFYVALGALDEMIATVQQLPEGDPAAAPLATLTSLRGDATPLLKLAAVPMDLGIDLLLRTAADKAGLRVKGRFDAALTGHPFAAYGRRLQLIGEVFPRLFAHTNAVEEVVGDVARPLLKVMRAAQAADAAARLAGVAAVPALPGADARYRRWVLAANEAAGNVNDPGDALATDVAVTSGLARDLRTVELQMGSREPTTAEAADLAEQRADLKAQLSTAIEASVNPAAVAAAVAVAAASPPPYLTKVAAAIEGGLTDRQEECVMARGRLVVAAGAGSGKTRVLASKVVYHMQELNLTPANVMAVSFSRKSSGELKERVLKYGAAAGLALDPEGYYPGWGTTHSIARMVLNQSGRFKISASPDAREQERVIGDSDLTALLKVAIAQVQMSGGNGKPPWDQSTFFPNRPPAAPAGSPSQVSLESVTAPIQNPSVEASHLEYYLQDPSRYAKMVSLAVGEIDRLTGQLRLTWKDLKTKYGDKRLFMVTGPGLSTYGARLDGLRTPAGSFRYESASKWDPNRYELWAPGATDPTGVTTAVNRAVGFDVLKAQRDTLKALGAKDASTLTPAERIALSDIVTQPVIAAALKSLGSPVAAPGPAPKRASRRSAVVEKVAADTVDDDAARAESDWRAVGVTEESLDAYEGEQDRRVKENTTSPWYYWYNNPAKQWFNLGLPESAFELKDKDGKTKKAFLGEFKRYIGLKKAGLVAPGEAWKNDGENEFLNGVGEDDEEVASDSLSPMVLAATYGAFEWLKGNVPHLKGRLDYDDQLIQSSRVLIENPGLLRRYQQQYKCVLVDEAQDLNACQHLLFGLIAGYLDPATRAPKADGAMTADTFGYIGDDKQAIYEFRGAIPDKFISKSNLLPGGEGFKTLLLDTNYRSGSEIVEAANRLIAYNSKQIPMVCKANTAKNGAGAVTRVPVGLADEGPAVLVKRIERDLAEAKAEGRDITSFYRNYGLALRTNREVDAYAMAMIEAGIPFRSKRDFFSGPALGPIVAAFRLFDPATNVADRNGAFLRVMRAPDFGMSPTKVREKLEAARAGDFLAYFTAKDNYKLYGFAKMDAKAKAYRDYLLELQKVASGGNSKALLNLILSYKTPDGASFSDQLAAEIRNDQEAMEEVKLLAEEEGDGEVTPDMLVKQALKPIEPLMKVAEKFPAVKDFVGYINSLVIGSKGRNKTDSEDVNGKANCVTVDTCHGWKGLEVQHIFIPMNQGTFPHGRSLANNAQLEGERRLAYVAITRGQQSVTVIEPRLRETRKGIMPVEPSQFVVEACIGVAPTPSPASVLRVEEEAYASDDDAEAESADAEGRQASAVNEDAADAQLLAQWEALNGAGA